MIFRQKKVVSALCIRQSHLLRAKMRSMRPRYSVSKGSRSIFLCRHIENTARKGPTAMASSGAQEHLTMHEVQAVPITSHNFALFGQFVEPIDDMKPYDQDDAQLQLNKGMPRFYIMRLPQKPAGLTFTQITHHKEVTQCLGSLTPEPWYMAVAPPGIKDLKPENISAFKVPFGTFIKMNPGTWHAGPLFDTAAYMDFYNLELADTNQADHNNFYFDGELQAAIQIMPC